MGRRGEENFEYIVGRTCVCFICRCVCVFVRIGFQSIIDKKKYVCAPFPHLCSFAHACTARAFLFPASDADLRCHLLVFIGPRSSRGMSIRKLTVSSYLIWHFTCVISVCMCCGIRVCFVYWLAFFRGGDEERRSETG